MIFGNLIPLLLAYKFPQLVALGLSSSDFSDCPHRCWLCHLPNEKTGITAIDPDMLSEKESKQLLTLQVLKQVCSLVYGCFYNSSSQYTHR